MAKVDIASQDWEDSSSQSMASLKHTPILDQELLDSYTVIQLLLLLLYDCNFKLTYFRTYNPNKLT